MHNRTGNAGVILIKIPASPHHAKIPIAEFEVITPRFSFDIHESLLFCLSNMTALYMPIWKELPDETTALMLCQLIRSIKKRAGEMRILRITGKEKRNCRNPQLMKFFAAYPFIFRNGAVRIKYGGLPLPARVLHFAWTIFLYHIHHLRIESSLVN